jgi:NADH-quinone oxidoreductase subunit M
MSILPWLLLIPLISAVIVVLMPRSRPQNAAYVAFALSLIPAAMVGYLLSRFDYQDGARWQMAFACDWIPSFGITFSLGLDAISLWLIVLTAFLTPLSILGSFNYIKQRQPEFYAWLLALHAGMLGVFCARDLLLFYLFFEFTLIPMFFIIGIWGGSERRKAAAKFFLFTFAGSVLTLVSVVAIAILNFRSTGTLSFAMDDLYKFGQSGQMSLLLQSILLLGLLAGFSVKVPLFPFHTWLPLAHTEAPTAGSVILAGVLLKLGTYGMLRFALPLLPQAAQLFSPYIAAICIIGIVYGALVSWVQQDMKKLIAYSSVSHLGFCVLGMFALTQYGITGSVLYMVNHGLSTGALFLVVGMIYERYHTRDMNELSGLARRLPALGFFAVFFVFSSVALPGLNGFVSEFMVLLGTFVSGRASAGLPGSGGGGFLGPWFAACAATGVILGAVYLLYWAGRVVYGPLKEPAHDEDEHASHEAVKDLSAREWCVLTPVAIAVVLLGVYPKPVLDSLAPAVEGVQKAAMSQPPEAGKSPVVASPLR